MEDNWLDKCMKCQYCYTKKSDDTEYLCRVSKSGACKFKPYKPKKKVIFSKKNFELNAPSHVKKLIPQADREALDGKRVAFDKHGFGTAYYFVNGKPCYLYPIDKDWCEVIE